MAIRKVSALKIEELNNILKSRNEPVTGNKAEKVAKVIALLGAEEIDEEEVEPDAMQQMMQQYGALAKTIEGLSKAVIDLTFENRITSQHMAQIMAERSSNSNENTNVINHNIQPPVQTASRGAQSEPVAGELTVNARSTPMSNIGHHWSIKDVKGLIPEFDPLKKIISPQQFIDKAEMLQRAYNWNDEILLVSVQHQLKGAAKNWCDAQPVFVTWREFVIAFCRDFPTTVNSADYHRQLMKQRKKYNQTLIEFYYETLAIGRRGQIDDEAIVTYVIEGVNDPALVKTLLAQNIKTCNELLGALENLTGATNYKVLHESNQFRPKFNADVQQNKSTTSETSNGPRCYNCQERGHIAAKCPQQKKLKCDKCQLLGHEAKNCYVKIKPNISLVHSTTENNEITPPLFKDIYINNVTYQGFVDTGSSHSLIETTEVPTFVERKQTNVMLKGFGGTCVESQEAFTTKVSIDDETFNATFYIIPEGMSPYPILLGRNILCRADHSLTICVDEITIRSTQNHSIMNVEADGNEEKFVFDINKNLEAEQIDAVKIMLKNHESTTVAEQILSISPSAPEDWVSAMQLQDNDVRDIIHALEENTGENMQQLHTDYVIFKNRLYRKLDGNKKLVVPKTIRWRITKACHDDCGHFGLEKTIARINQDFWFPRIRKYVQAYIDACPDCCYNKAKGGKHEGQLHISDAEPIPFRTVHMDHLGPFIKSKKGNQYVIVLVCHFSKYVIMRAVRNTKTTPVLQFLRDNMAFFGQPGRIITDRGTAFTSHEFESYMNRLGINHIKNAVRTPRANGQVERVNRTLLASLKCTTGNIKEWDTNLNRIQWSINSQPNATTKFSPNQLIFNFQLRNVSENRLIQAIHEAEPINSTEYDNMKMVAAENINKQQRKWKTRFDRNHCKPKLYNVDDLVVIDYVSSATGLSHKLDPQYKGPYIVTKVLGSDRYLVEDLPYMQHTNKRYSGVMSSDHMKPWCRPNCQDDNDEDDNSESGEAEL